MTEVEGKATGWSARFVEGQWVEELAKKKATKPKKAKAK